MGMKVKFQMQWICGSRIQAYGIFNVISTKYFQ